MAETNENHGLPTVFKWITGSISATAVVSLAAGLFSAYKAVIVSEGKIAALEKHVDKLDARLTGWEQRSFRSGDVRMSGELVCKPSEGHATIFWKEDEQDVPQMRTFQLTPEQFSLVKDAGAGSMVTFIIDTQHLNRLSHLEIVSER